MYRSTTQHGSTTLEEALSAVGIYTRNSKQKLHKKTNGDEKRSLSKTFYSLHYRLTYHQELPRSHSVLHIERFSKEARSGTRQGYDCNLYSHYWKSIPANIRQSLKDVARPACLQPLSDIQVELVRSGYASLEVSSQSSNLKPEIIIAS